MKDKVKNYTATMVEATFVGSSITIVAYDMQKSLWQDYEYFKNETSKPEFEDNLKHRYARICLMLLFSHMAAVTNNIMRSPKFTEGERKKDKLDDQIEAINTKLGLKYEMPKRVRYLRNYLEHFGGKYSVKDAEKSERNLHKMLHEDITMELVREFETDLIQWLEQACEKTNKKRLPLKGAFDSSNPNYKDAVTKEL